MSKQLTATPKITLVKKILADGSPCKKCNDVVQRLESAGQMRHITNVIIADESNPESEGMQLAQQLDIDKAPFFIVEQAGKETAVYTIYFKLVKEVLNDLT